MRRFLLVLLLLPSLACANGSVSNVTISKIEADSSGRFYFYFSASISGGPACATDNAGFVVDGTTAAGAVVVSTAITAYALGKTLGATGSGQCNVNSSIETIADLGTSN